MESSAKKIADHDITYCCCEINFSLLIGESVLLYKNFNFCGDSFTTDIDKNFTKVLRFIENHQISLKNSFFSHFFNLFW